MLTDFQRFAVYYSPPDGSDLARAGAAWLGWDAHEGRPVAHPDLGLDLARITDAPRKYGLHGTLKPPMRLACPKASFLDAVETLAQGLAPVAIGKLCLRPLEGFLAFLPELQPQELSELAAQIVQSLDPYRAPLSEHELARRRAAGLSPRQEGLLQHWGYPYVLEEFRFHVTLTGRLDPAAMSDALRAAHAWFGPALSSPQTLDALCVFGEDESGRFHLLRRVPLRG